MDFRKHEFEVICPLPFREEDLVCEERKVTPRGNGSQLVEFVKVPLKELSDRQLDPREITLDYCIRNNIFIEPKNAQTILGITDPADIEALAGRISEESYSWLVENEKNFDLEKNSIVESEF